jgi:hypothetical protein
MYVKHKLLFNVIALRLLFTDVTFGKNINFTTLEIFLTASISAVASKKKIPFVQSKYQGVLSFTDLITGFITPNSAIPHPGFKIHFSDMGNLNYDRTLAKED